MKLSFTVNFFIKTINVTLAGLATVSWARIGGVEIFGLVSGFTFATMILAELIDKGNSTFVVRNYIKNNFEYNQWPSQIPRIIARNFLCIIPLMVILVLTPLSNRITFALLLINLPFFMINTYFQQFAYGYSKLKQVNIGISIEKFFWFSSIPLSLFNYNPNWTIPFSIVLGSLAQNLYALVDNCGSTKCNGLNFLQKNFSPASRGIRSHGSTSISTFRIIGNIFYLDISALSLLAGSTAAGYYAVGARLRSILTIGFTLVSDLVGPKLIGHTDWRNLIIKRDFLLILIVSTFGCIVTFLFARPLTLLLLGSDFLKSVFFVQCFSVTCFVLGIVTILRTFLISLFLEVFVARIYMFSFLLFISCFPLVVIKFGSKGVAILTLTIQIVIALLFFARLIKIK